jgi:hypothetical protein
MASSRLPAPVSTPVSRREHLVELLGRIPDPGKRRGVRHPVGGLIAVAVCAVVTGAQGFTAIGEWAKDAGVVSLARLARLGLAGARWTRALRRLFARLDADLLDAILGAWAVTRTLMAGSSRAGG